MYKRQSHNHPSAVEPFEGAATGVGGILRDVIALGARPIAILDSLRFGELDTERTRYLVDGVVRGIGHYGNSMGIPTVGGEIYFDPPYEQNPLVNAMCVGIARTDEMVRAAAQGPGNKVVMMGSLTGRDGIGGASVLASAELDASDEKRPTVQVGDPFAESKLLECSLELLAADLVVAMQDLGAAGLTSAASEMASGGEVGLDLDVGKVPLREADMEPFEIMVSESQERMLAVVTPELVDEVMDVCRKWQTVPAVIGEITDSGDFRILRNGETVGVMAVDALVDGCPLYDLDPVEPSEWIYGNRTTLETSSGPSDIALALLGSPSIASKKWIYEQYDSVVGSRTVHRAGAADAAVLKGWASFPEPMVGEIHTHAGLVGGLTTAGTRRVSAASSCSLTSDVQLAADIVARLGCDVEHNEVFGVALACAAYQIPFAAVFGVAYEIGPKSQETWRTTHRTATMGAASLIAAWLRAGAVGVPHGTPPESPITLL